MDALPFSTEPTAGQRRQTGFTLLEVLVAVVLLGLVLSMLLRVYAGALRNVGHAEGTSQAMVIADSLLASVGTVYPLAADTFEGTELERFDWRLQIVPSEAVQPDADAEVISTLFDVSAEISWQDGVRQRRFRLDTLRTGDRR